MCSVVSFLSTFIMASITAKGNALQRNVRYLLLADCMGAFSNCVTLVSLLLAQGSNTFGSYTFNFDEDYHDYDIIFFVTSLSSSFETCTQIISTVLASALGYKMIKYLEAHKRDQTPLRPRKGSRKGLPVGRRRLQTELLSRDNPLYRLSTLSVDSIAATERATEHAADNATDRATEWDTPVWDEAPLDQASSGGEVMHRDALAKIRSDSSNTDGDGDDVDEELSEAIYLHEL